MKEPIKFKNVHVDTGSKAAGEAMDFVSDVKNGKYNIGNLELNQITY